MTQPALSALQLGHDRSKGAVSALLLRPDQADFLYVMAHGAGADMRHRFLESMADELARVGIATLRFNFPYLDQGRRSPDPQPVLEAYVRAACAEARRLAPELPLFAGGKSMGGRMTSNAAAREPIDGLRGIAFLGFPLHAPKRPGRERAAHLLQVTVPMLFLQGTRDDLAELSLMREVCMELGARATLHEVATADHSFEVLRKAGRSAADVRVELARVMKDWMEQVV
ncbi:MAG TPA: alpha/beta family hydrolase [Longimicrobiales bacterium]|nr:alpha/beta family hydrolase [Longimicrobiales bacterium]